MTGSSETVGVLCATISTSLMFSHLAEFAKRVKLSGTAEELESFRYLKAVLDGYGYVTSLIQHDAYLSLPGRALLKVAGETPRCITHSFSRSSPVGGLTGLVVYVGQGTDQDFTAADVKGRVVLVEGLATPAASLRASRAGALGQIHISPDEHLHEMCVSPVWGSPDTETVHMLPSTVVLTIARSAGERIKARIADGEPVEATINAEIETGWRATPLLVAELPPHGQTEGPFVLFSGHHDTWHYGVMDNGGANAVMLEVARIVAGRRTEWRRGLRLCFWSGHSHGRYSGSAWYADHRWQELERRCAVHVYVDSAGAKCNTVLADMPVCAELKSFAREVIWEQGQQELTGLRMSRAGDQSFWGIGVPSLFMTVGEQPLGSGENVLGSIFAGSGRKGAGFGWWWHTPDDTLDKMDEGLLGRDTRIYLHAIWALLTSPILPLDYEAYAASLAAELGSLRGAVEPVLDLRDVIARVEDLAAGARALKEQAGGSNTLDDGLANAVLMKLSRCLVPLDYTSGDRFGHDLALPQAAFPVLDPLRLLVRMPEGSEGARFAAVGAVRARNRIRSAIEEAIQIVEGFLGPNPVTRN